MQRDSGSYLIINPISMGTAPIMKSSAAKSILAVVSLMLLCATAASAQSKRVDVKFSRGASSGTYTNALTGYRTVDFYVKASGGQLMSASLKSPNRFLYFVVLKDLENMESVADDAREVTEWSGALPADGTYIVRVYLVRAEARRNRRAVRFSLDIAVQ